MGRLFAGNERNKREHVLITSFPDRNSLGGEGAHLQPGPQKFAKLRIKHLVCAASWVGPWGSGGNRLDTLPGPLELTFLWEETIGDNQLQWRGQY